MDSRLRGNDDKEEVRARDHTQCATATMMCSESEQHRMNLWVQKIKSDSEEFLAGLFRHSNTWNDGSRRQLARMPPKWKSIRMAFFQEIPVTWP